jgi:hypothetical protein
MNPAFQRAVATGLAPHLVRVHRTGLRTNGDNVTDPGFPIYRRPKEEDVEREATITQQDAVDAVSAFKRYTSEESRDLLAAGRDDEDAD